MENKTNLPDVPYLVHEQDMARQERTIKRVWILCIILIIALIGSNAGWLYYESQWQVVENSTEVTQDVDTGNGNANVTGIGDINGTGETDGKDNN